MTEQTTPQTPSECRGRSRRLTDAFHNAFAGFGHLCKTERNAKIHLAAAGLCVATGWCLRISALEWAVVALSIGLVFSLEAMNAALERLADATHPELHPLIGHAKDVSAAAVLLAALAALAVAVAVFVPRLMLAFSAGL